MGNEPEKQPETKSVSPNKRLILGILDGEGFRKILRSHWYDEKEGLRKGWIGTLLTVIIVSSLTLWAGHHYWNNKYESSKTELTANYDAKTKELTTTLDTTKGELKDAKQDRDKYQIMLAPFQAMAIQVYTNVPMDKRLDLLASQFSSVSSNLLNTIESERPYFDLYINNILITNGSVISLKESRTVNPTVRNISPITADGITVEFLTPFAINSTNFQGGEYWKPEIAGSINLETKALYNIQQNNIWVWMAEKPLIGLNNKMVNSFNISTNMIYSVIGDVVFRVSASRSKVQTYKVTLAF